MTEQKNTIWYGIGKTAKELGPKAWEKRIDDVIKNKILPKSSPKMKAWIEQNQGWIAKAGGWVATGVEVGVVAGVVYGGVRVIKRLRQRPVAESQSTAPPVSTRSIIHGDLLAGLAAAGVPDPAEPERIPDWLAQIQASPVKKLYVFIPAQTDRLAGLDALKDPDDSIPRKPRTLHELRKPMSDADRANTPDFIRKSATYAHPGQHARPFSPMKPPSSSSEANVPPFLQPLAAALAKSKRQDIAPWITSVASKASESKPNASNAPISITTTEARFTLLKWAIQKAIAHIFHPNHAIFSRKEPDNTPIVLPDK